jgi:diguanylate cyclase (GGDEF)-like protein
MSPRGRDRWRSLLSPVAAVLLLLAAGWFQPLVPRGQIGPPLVFLALWLCASALAIHRPLSSRVARSLGLGLGLLAVPVAILWLGVLPAAWLTFAAGAVSCIARRATEATIHPGGGVAAVWEAARKSFHGCLERGAIPALAVLAAGALWRLCLGRLWLGRLWPAAAPAPTLAGALPVDAGPPPAATTALSATVGVAVLLYLALVALLPLLAERLQRTSRRPARWAALAPRLAPLALEASAALAGLLVASAAGSRPWLGIGLLAVLALLSLEAFRHARQRRAAEHQIADLERVDRAGRRMIASPQQLATLVDRLRAECRRVLAAPWFQFELLATATGGSWFAGPDGVLHEGVPRPGSSPPTLPGFHRRVSWRVLDYPLEAENRVLACLRLWCDPRTLRDDDRELLERLLPQMAASVHRCLLDHDAKSDPLTGVALRRVLEERLERAWRRAMQDGTPFSVVMLDLDHFKRINDSHGHDTGDRALQAFAEVLTAHTREPDLCCRYGGEEFTWLLENTTGLVALAAADRLRAQVAAMTLTADDEPVPVTMSAGVASFPELHVKTASELLLLADEALYEAKEQGRNQCLLGAGPGRFTTVGGDAIVRDDAPTIEAPRFFS